MTMGWLSPKQRRASGIFLGVKCSRRVRPTTSCPSVSRLSRQCGIFSVSQSYRPSRSVTGVKQNKLRGLSSRVNYILTERLPLFGEVSATFADRGCCVVNTMDPYGRIFGFLDWLQGKLYLFFYPFVYLHMCLF
jgi:hypothetical protein